MRSPGLPLVSLLLPALAAAAVGPDRLPVDFGRGDCRPARDYSPFDDDTCAKPVEAVVAVATDSSYLATIACTNCPYIERNASDVPRVVRGDYELVRVSPCRCVALYPHIPLVSADRASGMHSS
jgi:hypothetical protein